MADPTSGLISAPEQLEALVSGVRQDIVDTLASTMEMSVRELSRHLGMRPSALYYHMAELERVGLVARHPTGLDGTSAGATFSACEPRLEIDYRLDREENRTALARIARSILRLARRDFERGLRHPAARAKGSTRNLWAARGKAWLTDADLERVNQLLAELSDIFAQKPRTDGTLCAITWVVTPTADRSDPES